MHDPTPGQRLRRLIERVYYGFELAALAALFLATAAAITNFFYVLFSYGFQYTTVLEKILLVLVFVDLTRTLVASIVAGRFRMDILLEAIAIALARDLILGMAAETTHFSVARTATTAATLVAVVLLWVVARRVEAERRPLPSIRLLRR